MTCRVALSRLLGRTTVWEAEKPGKPHLEVGQALDQRFHIKGIRRVEVVICRRRMAAK